MSKQQQNFKNKRDQFVENIRKTNREQIFSKKRNIIKPTQNVTQESIYTDGKGNKMLIVDQRYAKQIQGFLRQAYTMDDFFDLVNMVFNQDILNQHHGTIGIRKLISVHKDPPIQAIIDAGLVPRMIDYVKQENFPQLQLQATWTLTNVASGTTTQTQSIIDKGGIALFISLLLKENLGIVEQAIWAIGNISSDCTFYRDTILRQGGLLNLIKIIQNPYIKDRQVIQHTAWAITNLCRGNPLPKYDYIKAAIPILCQLIRRDVIDDEQVISDICWSIGYSCDSNRVRIQQVIATGIIPKIITMLDSAQLSILVPCLRIVGNISTGNAEQTDVILKNDVLIKLQGLLDHHKKVVRRQTCWILSNIAAGNREQVQSLLTRSNLLAKLLKLWAGDPIDVRKQCCYIFSNFVYGGQAGMLFELYKKHQVLNYYVNMLDETEPKAIQIALDSLQVVLRIGQKVRKSKGFKMNPFVVDLMNSGSVQRIEKLQYHQSQAVYNNVVKILTQYFDIEDPLAV